MKLKSFNQQLLLLLFTMVVLTQPLIGVAKNLDALEEEQGLQSQGELASQTLVLGINGKISKNLLAKLSKTIEAHAEKKLLPGHFLVLIDSDGGDGEAAIDIGRLLRKNNAFIFVTNRCASACVMVYLSGVYRLSIPASIGIHPPRITLSDRNARVMKEIQPENNEIAKKLLAQYELTSLNYFKEMNIDLKFFEKLKSLNSPNLYWLNESEIKSFNLDGFDTVFAEKELRNLRKDFNPTLMQPDFTNQINATLKNCVYFKNNPTAFSSCYRKNLQDGSLSSSMQ